jgi:23S rRNA (cytidine1920-2'-O)/16S rRNA (cytidine1409-2'-O)-methyltransferase
VYGIDVGYGQVAWKLRQDPRVILRERTNLRHLTPVDLYDEQQPCPDLGVADLSFISLTKVLPALWHLLQSPREVILLVKPQFEVGREKVGKHGVVKTAGDQAEAIWSVLQAAVAQGWAWRGLTWSPLVGPAGNIEYLLWLSMPVSENAENRATRESVRDLTYQAHQALSSSRNPDFDG